MVRATTGGRLRWLTVIPAVIAWIVVVPLVELGRASLERLAGRRAEPDLELQPERVRAGNG